MKQRIERLRNLGFNPKTILDIGAYRGDWARMAKEIFPAARLHCFEAQPGLEPNMVAVVDQFGLSVSYTMSLLGAEPKDEVDFHILSTNWGSTGSSIYREVTDLPTTAVKLPLRTVDGILAGTDLGPVDLIKIDVQGAEIDVLTGAVKAMGEAQALIAELSLVNYNAGAPLIHEVMAFLAAHDFVLYDIIDNSHRHNNTLIQIDGLFLRSDHPLRQPGQW